MLRDVPTGGGGRPASIVSELSWSGYGDSLARRRGQLRHDGDEVLASQLTTQNQRRRSVPSLADDRPGRASNMPFGASARTSTPFFGLVRRKAAYITRQWPADGAARGSYGKRRLAARTTAEQEGHGAKRRFSGGSSRSVGKPALLLRRPFKPGPRNWGRAGN